MIRPKKLKKGDTIAIVSLSSGMGGDEPFIHKYKLGVKRLKEMGFKVKTMSNALKGSDYLYKHPEKRAEDFINALQDKKIKAIMSMIGGDDTIRLLPYINFDVIKNNPKIFMGYSDTTVNHFMMYKAGVISYYGPAILSEIAENGAMHKYTKKYFEKALFTDDDFVITSADAWTNDRIDWTDVSKDSIFRKMKNEEHGYEILQGSGIVEGTLLGGCLDVFSMFIGTEIWPSVDEWEDKILFLETSEDKPSPDYVTYFLRNLVAIGVIDKINGIIVGKPKSEVYYEEYKDVFKKVIGNEADKPNLPILYNVNFGHTAPMCVLPLGEKALIDLNNKTIIIKQS